MVDIKLKIDILYISAHIQIVNVQYTTSSN